MNKLFTFLGAALLGLGMPLAAAAQTPAPADTARTYKHEFGLTASPQLAHFFTANRSLPIGLFYRRQLTPAKALRLRLVGQFSYADSTNFADDPIGIVDAYVMGPSYRQWQLQAFVGYEWQRHLNKNIVLTYGLEGGLGYNRLDFSSALRRSYQPGGFVVDYFERTTQTWQVQARPFAGFRFHPIARLCLFAEMALPLTYTHQRMRYQVRAVFTKPDEVDRFLNERAIANRVAVAWRPIQLIGTAYSF